jgi:curved DNA-binding protein CbpA
VTEFEDYYEILQVHPKAEPEVIEKAFKTLILKYHPDTGGDNETAKRITGAYYVLKDPERRREYDQAHARHRATGTGGAPVGAESAYVRVEDIPPEVIDAILAAAWVAGAAATVRTAGRVAAAPVVKAYRRARDDVRAEEEAEKQRLEAEKRRLEDARAEYRRQVVAWVDAAKGQMSPSCLEWLTASTCYQRCSDPLPGPPPKGMTIDDRNALISQNFSSYASRRAEAVLASDAFVMAGDCPRCRATVAQSADGRCARCHARLCPLRVVTPDSDAFVRLSNESAQGQARVRKRNADTAAFVVRAAGWGVIIISVLSVVWVVWGLFGNLIMGLWRN